MKKIGRPAKSTGKNSALGKEWRRLVRQKCGDKCAHCDETERLHTHHIVPWRDSIELRFDVSNGMLLCVSCHMKEEWKCNQYKREVDRSAPRSDETRKRISMTLTGKKCPSRGRPQSQERRRELAERMKGNTHTLGRKLTNDHKQKITKSLIGNQRTKGKKLTEEHKRKCSESLKGRKFSEEHLANMRAASQRRWAAFRAAKEAVV